MAPALASGGALAQQGAETAGAPAGGLMEELVVTGTQTARTGFDTPQSVSLFSQEQIERFTASSQADILTQLPGVSAEGGGGEVATNFFVRGLPSGGQFQFTPLQYDGIPAFTTFGLNSSAFDVYVRNDLSIQRLEYVTGGVSNLFGPGSVAGIINYITKKGEPETRGTLGWSIAILIFSFFGGMIAATVIEAINKVGSVFYGPILATFVLAVLFKQVSARGANWGLVSGVAFNIYLWLGEPQVFWFWWNLIGFLVTVGVAILVSGGARPALATDGPTFIAPLRQTAILVAAFATILVVISTFPSLWTSLVALAAG